MEQRSDEWFAARLGKVTASRMADLTARTRSGWGASRENYMVQLLTERLTGQPTDSYTNAAMQWGTDTEPQARAAYEFFSDNAVSEIGFVDHPDIPMSGASPDGLIGLDGNLELKCPNTATHLATLESNTIASRYLKQIDWQMACTGAKWTDFVSFDPRLPVNLQLFVKRIERGEDRITELEKLVSEFLAELDARIAKLNERQAA